MIETLGQLFETLSSLDPSITFGSGIGLVSLGYLAYSLRKNKNKIEPSKDESENDSRDINAITMATKNFDVDDTKSSEITSYGHLDNFVRPSKDGGLGESHTEPHSDDFTKNSVLNSSNENFSKDFPSSFEREEIEQEFQEHQKTNASLPKQPEFLDQFATIDMNSEESKPVQSSVNPVFENPEPLILKDIPEVKEVSTPDLNIPSINTAETSTLKEENSFVAPLASEEDDDNEANKLLNFAIESDNFGYRKDALTYLNQAIESEKELTSKVRLKIILRSYETEEKNLRDIVNSLPKIQPIKNLDVPKSAGVRFIKEENLKFVDDEGVSVQLDEVTTITPVENLDPDFTPDMSDLLAIPQVDIVSPIMDLHPVKTETIDPVLANGQIIDKKIHDMLHNTPSLAEVTFANVDTSSDSKPNDLDTFLESLADTIDDDNKLAQNHTEANSTSLSETPTDNQDLLSNLVISEVATKSENLETTSPHQNTDQNIESKKEASTTDFSSLNFYDFNDKSRPDQTPESSNTPEKIMSVEQDVDQTKVWVHIIINKDNTQEFLNKKFQLTHNWGTLQGNTSLNKQVSQWIKQNYSTTNFVITMVIPVQ